MSQRTSRVRRITVAAVGVAVAGAGAMAALPGAAGASPIPAGRVAAATTPPQCTTGQLRGSLRNAGSSTCRIFEVDPLNYPAKTCQLTTVAGLRVYPPNRTAPLFIPQRMKACADTSLQQLTIEAFGS